jgi:hypothetical protein
MTLMRATRVACALPCLLAAAALLGGCGGDSGSTTTASTVPTSAQSRPAPPASEFPSARNRTLRQVLKAVDEGPAEVFVTPAATVFYKGENRYPFGVSEGDHVEVPDADVAIYFARVPTPRPGAKSKSGNKGPGAKAEAKALDEPAVGPFPAAVESLVAKPDFQGKATPDSPDIASVVYTSKIDFPSNGEWRLAAVIKRGDELKAKLLPIADVGEFKKIPRPGQQAPKIHTPTAADVGGDLAKITTRVPPDTQNEVDYADALGKEPIVLLFATPKFCQSPVCGPVVDVAEQVKQETGEKAAFIHMEIYNDNDPAKSVRPQARAFRLPSEPWLFTINRSGVVSSVVEGAFGLERMNQAVNKVVSE